MLMGGHESKRAPFLEPRTTVNQEVLAFRNHENGWAIPFTSLVRSDFFPFTSLVAALPFHAPVAAFFLMSLDDPFFAAHFCQPFGGVSLLRILHCASFTSLFAALAFFLTHTRCHGDFRAERLDWHNTRQLLKNQMEL